MTLLSNVDRGSSVYFFSLIFISCVQKKGGGAGHSQPFASNLLISGWFINLIELICLHVSSLFVCLFFYMSSVNRLCVRDMSCASAAVLPGRHDSCFVFLCQTVFVSVVTHRSRRYSSFS